MNKEHKNSIKMIQETDFRLKHYIDTIRALEYDLNNVKTSAAKKILESELQKWKSKYETKRKEITLMKNVNTWLIKEGLIAKS